MEPLHINVLRGLCERLFSLSEGPLTGLIPLTDGLLLKEIQRLAGWSSVPDSKDLALLLTELRKMTLLSHHRFEAVGNHASALDSWLKEKLNVDHVEAVIPIIEKMLADIRSVKVEPQIETETITPEEPIAISVIEEQNITPVTSKSFPASKTLPIAEPPIVKTEKPTLPPLRIKLVTNRARSESINSSTQSPLIKRKKEVIVPSSKQSRKQTSAVEDHLKPKIANQIPINVFWSAVDPYFRPLNDNDVRFLEEKEELPEFYIIPPLGRFYRDEWNEQKESSIQMNDEDCGPLTERLLSALVQEKLLDRIDSGMDEAEMSDDQEEEPEDMMVEDSPQIVPERNPLDLEERIRSELAFASLYQTNETNREDDPVSQELRSLHAKLREQVAVNQYRKNILLEKVRRYLVHQEYHSVLDELDKQIEIGFGKRAKAAKKKRKLLPTSTSAAKSLTVMNVTQFLDKRNQLVERFKEIVPTSKEIGLPHSPIFSEKDLNEFVAARLHEGEFDLSKLPAIAPQRPLHFRVTGFNATDYHNPSVL